MFVRLTKDVTFYYKREEWKYRLNEDNFKYKPKFILYSYQKKMGKENFNCYKYWIFKKWIIKNFGYTQDFIRKFYRYARKLNIVFNSKEQEFIYNVEEVNFTLWRPLKILPIYFDLLPKEKCHFKNNDVNIHTIENKKVSFLCRGTLLITNKRFIIDGINDNKNNTKQIIFDLNDIEEVKDIEVGVQISVHNKKYLIREENNMLILALLHRALGRKKVEFDLNKLPSNFSILPKFNKNNI